MRRLPKEWKTPDPTNEKARRFVVAFWREVKIFYKRYMINWYFFYQPKDKGDKAWHVLGVLLVDVIILRVFGII